jgi:hypothetical protein
MRKILKVLKHGFFCIVCEIKTDLHVEMAKNCKALTGGLKRKQLWKCVLLPLFHSSLPPPPSPYYY